MIRTIRQRFSHPEAIERRQRMRERRWYRWLRRAGWTLVALYFLVALGMLAVRYLVVPSVADYRAEIVALASQTLGERVDIDAVTADWHGLHPRITLHGIHIYDRQGREALAVPQVRAVVAWRSVLLRAFYFRTLELEGLDVSIQRSADGKFYIAGLLIEESHDSRVVDWLLQQGELHLKGAKVTWIDEKRAGSPALQLQNLDFLLANEGSHHRFAFRADPPAEFASTIDVRGDLRGTSAAQLREWNGRFYAHFDYLDLAAWHAWVDYPFELRRGRGALRLWLGFAQDRVVEAHAQVALADVTTRFAKQLPLLELQSMQGEAGMEEKRQGFSLIDLGSKDLAYEAHAKKFALVSRNGMRLQLADINAHWEPGSEHRKEKGALRAKSIELGPLAALSEYLPLPAKLRGALEKIEPQGDLKDVDYKWEGPFEAPGIYSARGRFTGLGMRPYAHWPGFNNISGQTELSEKEGHITIEGKNTEIDFPGVFPEPIVTQTLAARLRWANKADVTDVQIENVFAENEDVTAASVRGSARIDAAGEVSVDLEGSAQRGRTAMAYRYIPYLGAETTTWLRESLPVGLAKDLRFKMRGAAKDFPYADPQRGQFKFTTKVEDVTLRYAADWPAIEHINGDLVFDGPALTIRATNGHVIGAQLSSVQARLDDLYHLHPVLRVTGRADGPTNEFLKFIGTSPARDFIRHRMEDWTASGNGRLDLVLDMPLTNIGDTKVRGKFEFFNNSVVMRQGEAPLNKVNGSIDFTETGASSPGLRAQYLNGPLNMQIASREGATHINAQGSADATTALHDFGLKFADRVRGMLPYRVAMVTRAGKTSLVFESSLQGVSSDLPAPLAKSAGEPMPLRLERIPQEGNKHSLNVSLGKSFLMQAQLREDGNRMLFERVGVGIDAPVPKAEGAYTAVAARFDKVDLDRAASLFESQSTGSPGAGGFPPMGTVDLRANQLYAGGRVFNDMNLRAQLRGSIWRADVKARELAGEVNWLPEGRGVVRARLNYLIHPEPAPQALASANDFKELPALDVISESYTLDGKNLGKLELRAVNEPGLWRIERAALSAPDGMASVSGTWRVATATAVERTDLNVDVQVQNIGRYLDRLGYVEAVSRGEGELKGKVGWNGPPFALHYASMDGELSVLAERGQFVKIKPGIGKLLGVLSLQSLPRRLTLDFRDVFSEGFAFDRIEGSASVAKGLMTTKDLSMSGPSASVSITGSADLERETQDLHVRVIPTVGDSVATAAGLALLNPLVGVGAFLTQRLLRDPIGQMFAFEYTITGAWEDPQVEKVGGPQRQATEPQGGKTATQ
ncbi:MAG TPA: YhdP family protein [Burkholderiales bacterium]|nr:YhdP family protein [Burkholderiales bacterium]